MEREEEHFDTPSVNTAVTEMTIFFLSVDAMANDKIMLCLPYSEDRPKATS